MHQSASLLQLVRFGVFEVDLRAGELRKRGVKVRIQEQPLQVLALLLERPGQLVTRDELREKLWAGAVVDFDHGINATINKLREALGDSAGTPRFIETLPRRGYRFIYPVNGTPVAGSRTEERSSAPARSIAVLPFVDLSEGRDQEYFADGIAEEILNVLAQVDGLRVVGRTSSFSFRGRTASVAEIAAALSVAHLLEGSVRREGKRVRITAQLIDAADGYHLWSQTYDREVVSIFAVQDEIARAVAGSLELKLLAGKRPTTQHRTASLDAYGEYLLGRHLCNRGSAESCQQAVKRFEKAIALDPGYSPAWAGLATALFGVADLADHSAHDLENLRTRALEAADTAVALGPDVSEAVSARGWLRIAWTWNWTGAQTDLQHALSLATGSATNQLRFGQLLAALGRLPEAIAATQRSIELDPLEVSAWTALGVYGIALGQYQSARDALNRALEIAPDDQLALRQLALAHLLDNQPAVALRLLERTRAGWSGLHGAALAHHDLGHPEESKAALDVLIARHSHIAALQIAQIYAWQGDLDGAFEWLEHAYAQHDTGLWHVKHSQLLAKTRGDPRWAVFLKKMNLPID